MIARDVKVPTIADKSPTQDEMNTLDKRTDGTLEPRPNIYFIPRFEKRLGKRSGNLQLSAMLHITRTTSGKIIKTIVNANMIR